MILTSILAAAWAVAGAAQTSSTGQQDQQAGTTTLTGCLYNGRDVPGRDGGDFVLVAASGDGTSVGTMYEVDEDIDDLDDDKLRALVGKRVELTGRHDDDDDDDDRADARQEAAGTSGTSRPAELPEFDATGIREVPGSCPATPAPGAPAASMSGDAVVGTSGHTAAAATRTATATETETQTHTAPVTDTPTYPAAQPQPQPQPQAPPPPVTQTRTYPETSPAPAQKITLTGCLYRERDVPGRTPNVAERAGVLEDYILADASVGSASPGATEGATGTSGAHPAIGKMFKVEHIADEKLAPLVGKRVEVIGTIDTEEGEMKQAGTAGAAGTTADRSAGPDRIELPEFEAASIREVAGTCPATPQK